jgi:hypothetical protein
MWMGWLISLKSCALLNCRNIVTDDHPPDATMQRARTRRGKPPFVTYKTLRVIAPSSVRASGGHAPGRQPPQGQLPLHLVRGHFATYTDDAPLFGKYAGRFWIHAHARGNVTVGTVLKDYKVEHDGRQSETP